MKSKKAMAVLCALAVVFTSSGGLPFGGVSLFDTAVTASAVETTDYTIDMRDQGYESAQEVQSVQDSAKIVTVTFDKGSNSTPPRYYTSGTAVRVYGGGTMTVSADSVITSIEFTFGSTDGRNAISANTGTYSEDDRKWTSDGSTNSVTFTVGGTSGNRRIQALKVTVENAATSTYTVTWNNADGTELEKDENVTEGDTPSYDGATPTKAEDETNTYTFSGWSDGTNTYGVSDSLPAVSADVTYTATFEATAKATDPIYTITIPAEVDLASTDPVNITAEDVTLGEGQKIIVTLDGASNTDSGSEFSAKTENGKSEVKYKINDGAIGLDDSNKTVAEFTADGSKELTFAVTDKSGIKAAGRHTEILTFTVGLDSN